jgi:maltose O-acetyltransferase
MNRSAGEVWANVHQVVRAQWDLRSATDVARTVRMRGHAAIQNDGTMIIGDRVQLVSTVATLELVAGPEGTLRIGARTLVNYGTSISAMALVDIGERCQIGTYCMIMDNDFHRLEPDRRLERPPSRPIVLEDNVWIGGHSIVISGVRIGADSVVGAGSVVTKDVPPRTVVAGVPARVIREL